MIISKKNVFGIIYLIKNTINNKVYIGQTTRISGFKGRYSAKGIGIERVYNHYQKEKSRNGSYNKHLLNSIEKYGFSAFVVIEEYDVAFSQSELDEKESYYINLFNSIDDQFGYNNKGGGNNGKRTEKTKRKDSISKLGWDIEVKKNEIISLYYDEFKSFHEIAKIYNVNKVCIVDNFKRWNLKPRGRHDLKKQTGKENPNAKIVEIKNINNSETLLFESINNCIIWLINNNIIKKQSDWKHIISKYINNGLYKGYIFNVYSKRQYHILKNSI